MSAFVLIILAVLIGDVAWLIWSDRQLSRVRRPILWRTLAAVWNGAMLAYLLYVILLPDHGRHAHAWMPQWALAVVYIWHLFVLPMVLIAMTIGGFGKLFLRLFKRQHVAIRGLSFDANEGAVVGPSRRQVLTAAMVAVPPLITAGAVGRAMSQIHDFRIRRFELPFPSLPAALDGMTIAQVSDVHVGRFTRANMLPKIADATNALKADLVLLTGDLIDLALSDLPAGLDFVRKLDPRSGLFMCEGNHDLIENPIEFETRVKSSGVPLLLDETMTATVRGTQVQLLGMSWRRGDAGIVGAMSRLVPQRRTDLFQILLAHHPHAFDAAAAVGVPLVLSGHTHGGQVMLNERLGMGSVMFRYWSGLYQKRTSTMIVSNGVGNWFPLRINAPAEIVHITLRAAH